MICTTCKTQLWEAFVELEQENSDLRLPPSKTKTLSSFYTSIRSGCFVCRHLWNTLQLFRQSDLTGIAAKELQVDFDSAHVPESEIELLRQIHHQQVEPFRGNESPRSQYTPDAITFTVSKRSRWISVSFFSKFSSMKAPVWSEFNLYPTIPVYTPQRPNPVASIELDANSLGTSTASVPALWSYWYHNCVESHILCRTLEPTASFLPKRLVEILSDGKTRSDKREWRVVSPNNADPIGYVTLSHCWGSSQPSKLTDCTISTFSTALPASDLPKTYQNALEIAVLLGFTYVWIDSLCIKQEDAAEWLEQAPQMAAIYGGARCNIAATWASDGTRGCFDIRDPFTVEATQISSRFARTYHIVPSSVYLDAVVNAPLNLRGWVVQERCLAARQLNFTKYQVYWECAELVALEQFPAGLPDEVWQREEDFHGGPSGMPTTLSTRKPRLSFDAEKDIRSSWSSLIESLSACRFTHLSDKMMALASLASHMREKTTDVYLAGHWRKDLLRQLCWKRTNRPYSPTRMHSRTDYYHAPTWSWASVDEGISADWQWFCDDYQREQYYSEILGVSVTSNDPEGLHSFTSGNLHIRAISLWAKCIDPENRFPTFEGLDSSSDGGSAILSRHGAQEVRSWTGVVE